MTPEQFAYWLQGKLEGRDLTTINHTELAMIKDHLQTVFLKTTPVYLPGLSNLPPGTITLPSITC